MENSTNNEYQDLGNPVFLTTAANEFEADLIISKLKASGIIAIMQYPGFGSIAKVYCGRCNFEVNIMVPEQQLEDARAILNDSEEADQLFIKEAEASLPQDAEPSEIPQFKNGFIAKLTIFIFLIVFLVILFTLAYKNTL